MSGERPDVAEWLRRAQHDLLAIERVAVKEPIPWDIVCFHAQQAAEKLLKALLIRRGIDPPRTHDLNSLLGLLDHPRAGLHTLGPDCELLTPMATTARYPTLKSEPTEAEGRDAIAAVERIRTAVLPLIGQ